jgi:hypothetical protein
MKQAYKISSLVFILLISSLFLGAQNNTSSPYSVYGVGELASVGYGRNLAIGGTGFAVRDHNMLNLKNPASLTSIDSLNFLFEMGVNCSFTRFIVASDDDKQESWGGNLSHVTFGHRYNKWIMGAYGIAPYSNIGYTLLTQQSLEGEQSYVYTTWHGTGGLTKYFYNVGVKVFNNLSLGGEVAYLYGPFDETRKTWAVIQSDNPTYFTTNTRYRTFTYKGAFQYSQNLGKKGTNITIGGTISPQQKLRGWRYQNVEQQYGSTIIDSLYYTSMAASPLLIPLTYGAGVSLTWRGRYLLTADYEKSNWSVNTSRLYVDQTILSIGFERLPKKSLNYFDRCSLRAGFRYDSGYVKTKGYMIDDARATVGLGLPVLKSGSMISVTYERGSRGTTKRNLILERYNKLSVAFSMQDLWFGKRKLN